MTFSVFNHRNEQLNWRPFDEADEARKFILDYFPAGAGVRIEETKDRADPQDDKPKTPNRPHYKLTPEPIDAIEGWGLSFRLANVVKYLARAERSGKRREDLCKAVTYLYREINALDGNSGWGAPSLD